MFRIFKFVHVNPFYLFLLIGYGLTRLLEWITSTSQTWSSLWSITSPIFDRHKSFSYIFGLPVYVITLHWIFSAFFVLYDITRCSRFMQKFKVQEDKREKLDRWEWISMAKIVLTNQLIILPTSMILSHFFLTFTNDLHVIDFSTTPSFSRMFYKFTLCMMIYEVMFFYLHWMLHHPLIYKEVHKQQQNYSALVTLNYHPIEYILLSVLTPALAIFMSRSDTVTTTFFMAAIVIGPIFKNFGFNTPYLFNNEYHHKYFSDYNGSNGMMDILHGTYENSLSSESFENHRILLSMIPIKRKCDE